MYTQHDSDSASRAKEIEMEARKSIGEDYSGKESSSVTVRIMKGRPCACSSMRVPRARSRHDPIALDHIRELVTPLLRNLQLPLQIPELNL